MVLPKAAQQIADHPLCTLKTGGESAEQPYFLADNAGYEDWADDESIAEIGGEYIKSGYQFSLTVYKQETDHAEAECEQEERDERERCIMHGPGRI